jgi:hypothetical protein
MESSNSVQFYIHNFVIVSDFNRIYHPKHVVENKRIHKVNVCARSDKESRCRLTSTTE